MPFTTNSPATYEHDNDGDLSPRPLDEIFAAHYYSKNPDPNVRIVTKERDEEDGRGKQPAHDGMDEDSSDEDEEE